MSLWKKYCGVFGLWIKSLQGRAGKVIRVFKQVPPQKDVLGGGGIAPRRSRSGGEKEKSVPPPGIDPKFSGSLVRSLYSVEW
jgi:hypothetical protein